MYSTQGEVLLCLVYGSITWDVCCASVGVGEVAIMAVAIMEVARRMRFERGCRGCLRSSGIGFPSESFPKGFRVKQEDSID